MTQIQLFKKLLKFKSITPNDDNIFEFITSYLGHQWECLELDFKDVKNRFYYKKFNAKLQHLCFAGHVDVVPPGDNWDTDPFIPFEKNGKIIARGAQDMKSGVSAFLYACKHSKNFDGTLSILLTSDEEGDAVNGTVKVLDHLKNIDLMPNYALVAEPTCEHIFGDMIKIGRRGSINGCLTINGKQGHAAYPEKSINPIHIIANLLSKIAGVQLDDGDDFFSPSQLIITDIRGGMEVSNVTPDNLKIMFNVRNSTKTNKIKLENFIRDIFKNLDMKLSLEQNSFPFMTNDSSKVVELLAKTIKKRLNVNTTLGTSGGTSDARFFGQYKVDTVEFGVINDTIHSVNESTSIEEIEKLTQIFIDLIEIF